METAIVLKVVISLFYKRIGKMFILYQCLPSPNPHRLAKLLEWHQIDFYVVRSVFAAETLVPLHLFRMDYPLNSN